MIDENFNCDVAIIGAGLAGSTLALSLDPKLKVALFCKGDNPGGASRWAQGGLAAVVTAEDSIEDHVADTLKVGGGLCDEAAVREIVSRGADVVQWLEKHGVLFTRGPEGKLDLHREGGHGRRRIVHASDATGSAILNALASQLPNRKNISLYPSCVAVDLATQDGELAGCYILKRKTQVVHTVAARTVVLASGGAGKVYSYTTNPDESTGDGIAMAWRVGCHAVNMEFVQFHPTALFHPAAKSVLISEVVRGEGAKLVNSEGDRFMESAHSDAEMAPRDVVARTIDIEMKKSGQDCVFLDMRHLPEGMVYEKFPVINKSCSKLGIDIAHNLIPVVPSAHYLCGGIQTDVAGRTAMEGLFAIGEVAHTGLHGANRLASNSLLECVATALIAAKTIGQDPAANKASLQPWDSSRVGPAHEEVMVAHNWDEIRRMMWNYVGIMRSDARLLRAKKRLELIAEEVDDHYRRYVLSSDFVELRNLLLTAKLIVNSAMTRRESRGLHYNLDCLQPSNTPVNTILSKSNDLKDAIAETTLVAG